MPKQYAIGVQHWGAPNARKLISVLKRIKLKRGDEVALELLLPWTTEKNLNIRFLEETLARMKSGQLDVGEYVFFKSRGLYSVEEKRAHIEEIIGNMEFFIPVVKYLLAKKVALKGFDITRSSKTRLLSTKASIGVQQASKERMWKRALAKMNPKVIIAGSDHLPAITSEFPAAKPINLSTKPLMELRIGRAKYAMRRAVIRTGLRRKMMQLKRKFK